MNGYHNINIPAAVIDGATIYLKPIVVQPPITRSNNALMKNNVNKRTDNINSALKIFKQLEMTFFLSIFKTISR